MAKRKIKVWIIIVSVLFLVYFFVGARPVVREMVLVPRWLSSFDSESLLAFGSPETNQSKEYSQIPFTLGSHFGYVDSSGRFALNRVKNDNIYLGDDMWTEFSAEPSEIEIKNIAGETVINIRGNTQVPPGYPVLLDNRVFILGSEQNLLSEIDRNGDVLWTYEFGSILTCIDVAAGFVLTGSIDGVIEILDSLGKRFYYFAPGGSRWETIYGCAISRNGSRIGIISGLDPQRFLLLERQGVEGDYRVVYHESFDDGYRRPVHVSFIDEDRRVVYERVGGINCYNIRSRRNLFVPLNGELAAMEKYGNEGFFFLITTHASAPSFEAQSSLPQRELVGIRFPPERYFLGSLQEAVFLRAPFKSEDVYLGRLISESRPQQPSSMLIVGGGNALISFDLEKR